MAYLSKTLDNASNPQAFLRPLGAPNTNAPLGRSASKESGRNELGTSRGMISRPFGGLFLASGSLHVWSYYVLLFFLVDEKTDFWVIVLVVLVLGLLLVAALAVCLWIKC